MELSGIAVPGQAIGGDKRKLDGFPASNNLLHNQLFEIVRKNAFFSLYGQVSSILFVQINHNICLYGRRLWANYVQIIHVLVSEKCYLCHLNRKI